MNIKPWQGFLIAVFFFAGFGIWKLSTTREAKKTIVEHVKPSRGDIEVFITATGSVQPQNRLEIKPPGPQSDAEEESCLFRRGALSPAELDGLIDLSLALRGTS